MNLVLIKRWGKLEIRNETSKELLIVGKVTTRLFSFKQKFFLQSVEKEHLYVRKLAVDWWPFVVVGPVYGFSASKHGETTLLYKRVASDHWQLYEANRPILDCFCPPYDTIVFVHEGVKVATVAPPSLQFGLSTKFYFQVESTADLLTICAAFLCIILEHEDEGDFLVKFR